MMANRIAVLGVNYPPSMGMMRLLKKLQQTMKEPEVKFFSCSSTGWEIYQQIVRLNVDKIIILDQFSSEEDGHQNLNYLSIDEQILVIGIDPIFFAKKKLSTELTRSWEQIIFQVRKIILREVSLDLVVQV